MKNLNLAADRLIARMDELGDDAIHAMRNTPEALAAQAANGAKARAAGLKREKARLARKDAAVAANTFTIGQTVRSNRRLGADFITATVVAVAGSTITLDNGRSFAASAFAPA